MKLGYDPKILNFIVTAVWICLIGKALDAQHIVPTLFINCK